MSLSCRGYGITKALLDEKTLIDLREELTIDVDEDSALEKYVESQFSKRRRVFMYLESDKKIYLPRAFGLSRFGDVADSGPVGLDSKNFIFNGELRPHQESAVDCFMNLKHKLGIISIPCGGGKTVIALKIASLVGKRTLIVLNKDFLIAQWRERINDFLPRASVGIIKAKKVDVDNRDVVLASLQSLSTKDYELDYSSFGMLIVDEVHRTGTHVFSKALKKLSCNVMLGLSATVERKDGMERIFKNYLGEVVYDIQSRTAMDSQVSSTTQKTRKTFAPEVRLVYFENPKTDEYSTLDLF